MSWNARSRESLRESQERFRRLSDVSFEGICVHKKGIILDCNKAFCRIFGYEESDLIGEDAGKFLSPECRNLVLQKITSGYSEPYEAVFLRKDGTRFSAEVTGKIAHYQGQEVRVTAIRDLTERIRVEGKLRESEEKLRIMFESTAEGIVVYNLDGLIVELNNTVVKLFGYQSRDGLLNSHAINLIARADQARAQMNMKRRLDGCALENAEYVCVKKDKTEFDAEFSVGVIRDSEGKPLGYVAIIRDVTERKRFEESMQYYISQVTKAQEEERKRLACELHDDTVQELIAVSLDIEAISKVKSKLPEEATRQLDLLRKKINKIMNDVRRFSHELRSGVLDRLGLVSALETLADELTERKINAQFNVTGPERRLSPDIELVLFRICQEALRNIWKHSNAGIADILLEFKPDQVKLSVTDNGQGFELPEPIDLAGKGKLGLIGMQERARLIHGNLVIKSKPGSGTTILIEAPA